MRGPPPADGGVLPRKVAGAPGAPPWLRRPWDGGRCASATSFRAMPGGAPSVPAGGAALGDGT